MTDFYLTERPCASRIRKNPHFNDIVEKGFSIVVHYSPSDVSAIINGEQIFDFDIMEHDPDEIAAFEKYRARTSNV
ncbi:MAG: hypothetical protein FWD90_08835 [Defluviitaleaceae bacterium]|nr:hypothetical protein [Defluviitaleaceae bacterium]